MLSVSQRKRIHSQIYRARPVALPGVIQQPVARRQLALRAVGS